MDRDIFRCIINGMTRHIPREVHLWARFSAVFTALLLYHLIGVRASAQSTGAAVLASQIDAIITSEEFENAFWGVVVVDLDSGQRIYERNARKSFVPASNTKLYTTSAALDLLGPDYVYLTRLYIDGPIEDGTLRGNVVVRGAADPTIGGHYDAETGEWKTDTDALHLFRTWADSLRAVGIQRIDGGIIGDDDIVDDVPLGPGWSWDDETYYYAAQLSGLSFHDNVIHMHLEAQDVDNPAHIRWEPNNTNYVAVINQSVTVHPDSSRDSEYVRRRGTNTIEVSTELPLGRKDVEEITVENPTHYFAHVLRETLLDGGIAINGDAVDVDSLLVKPDYSQPDVRQVAVHVSQPLSQIVGMVNKASQNLYADLLIKTLAAELPRTNVDEEPGSTEFGLEVAMSTFVQAGVDTSRIQLADGSGLSRHNLVTPEMTAALLQFMWTHPDEAARTAFYDSLPVAGVDGTLRHRMRQGPAHRNVRAKTGTLSNVSSLSGFVRGADDTPLAFVLMCNHYTTRTRAVRIAQDRVANVLARFSR